MTSQKWLTDEWVAHPIQWHTMVVIVPDNLDPSNWANVLVEFGLDNSSSMGLNPRLDQDVYQELREWRRACTYALFDPSPQETEH